MTPSTASIPHRTALNGDERPRVAVATKREREDSVRVVDACFTVGKNGREFVEPGTPGAHGELPNPTSRVEATVRILRREALVQMIVRRDDDVDALGVQDVPELLHLVLASMPPGAEARVVEVRDRAPVSVALEIGDEPEALRDIPRAGTAVFR